MTNVHTIRDGKTNAIIAWKTKCAGCCEPIEFRKVTHRKAGQRNVSTTKPDAAARCWPCWQKLTAG